ncbi:MAG: cytochrome-c peroxidase [Planctomycetota bacterium]
MNSRQVIPVVISALLIAIPVSAGELTPMEQLGKELFFDNISDPGSMSCATCHKPNSGWTGPIAGINLHGAVYRGAVPERFGNRKPPSTAYATFSPVFDWDEEEELFIGGNFWDGRATGERLGNPAADQALGPFLNPVEQNMPSKMAVCAEVENSDYVTLFEMVWGDGSLDCSEFGVDDTYDRIGLSIAAYEASSEVCPFASRFDEYWSACLAADNDPETCGLAEGDKIILDPLHILTEQEFDGLIEFGEYCAPCHVSHVPGPGGVPPLFTDFSFDNIGVPRNLENPFYDMDEVYLDDDQPINPLGEEWVDFGLGNFLRTQQEWEHLAAENDGKHKVPTLRNVDKRPGWGFPKAYMHNGVFKSLEEVVHFYNTRDVVSENWPPPEVPENVNREILEGVPLGDLELTAEDEAAIVAFLKTLTDRRPKQPGRNGTGR